MRTRQVRDRQHRLVVGASLVVSLALHGILFGTLSLPGPEPPRESPARSAAAPVLQAASLELVRIEAPVEQVVLEPILTDAPFIPTAPAAEEIPEPKSGEALVARAGDAAAAAAAPVGGAEAADDPLPAGLAFAEAGVPSTALSMKPRFGVQHVMPESTRKPIAALDPFARHDHAEGEGEEEQSWWRRLGARFGIGDGSKICVPRPEVIDESPEVAEK